MKKHGTKSAAARTGCASIIPTSEVEHVGAPRVRSERNEAPTIWMAMMTTESAGLREMLREAVAEAAERTYTASGRRKAMALLGTMYRHSVTNHQIADRASELDDVEVTIIVSELQEIIDDVIIRLEEVLATPPASARARHERAHQPEVGQ